MKVLTDIRLWIAIGLLCIAIFLWLATGLVTTGEPPSPLSLQFRIMFLLVLFLAIGSLSFAIHLRSKRTNTAVLQDISGSSATGNSASLAGRGMLDEEESQLREKFSEAAVYLKKKRFGRFGSKKHLYQLPWYIILGSPGSGKTTAVRQSGLRFPLDEITQGNSLGGVAGTRNCDWWITEQAVLLDTAGRYTTQDSDAAIDAKGWKNFLGLLRKSRKQQPINGAILILSTDELLKLSEDQWKNHTQTINNRLRELRDDLQLDFPVYLLITKVDLLPGCREFFDSLDADDQDQIWGATLSLDSPVEDLVEQLKALTTRLHEQIPVKLRHERNIKRRQAIYSFPWQMENIMSRVQGLAINVFNRQGLKGHTRLRGVYFTSAIQEGSPIERLFAAVTGGFGVSGTLATNQQDSRSLFLRQLFPRVIFPEAFMAGTNTAHDRRVQQWRLIAFACIIAMGIGLSFLWTSAFSVHRNLISQAKEDLSEFQQSPHGKERTLTQNLQSLQYLQSAAVVFDKDDHPWLSNFGMYDASVDSAAKEAYIRAMKSLLAPSVGNELLSWLSSFSSTDYRQNLEVLKAYLMLVNRKRRDNEWLLPWLGQSPVVALQQDTAGLVPAHLDALFTSEPDYQLAPIDEITVQRTRNMLSRITPAEAIYSQIKSMYAQESTDLLPELGPYFPVIFETRTGRLEAPSLYTVGGYQTVDFGPNSEAVRGWLSDRWVLGNDNLPSPTEISSIINNVKQLYSADYVRTWQAVLGDVNLLVPAGTSRLSETLGHLSETSLSPMSSLMAMVSEQTSLPGDSKAKEAATEAARDAVKYKAGRLGRVAGKIADSGILPEEFNIPEYVLNAFEPYHNMLRGDAGSKNARVTTQFGQVRQWLNAMQHSPDNYSANNPSKELLLTAQDLAEPFSGWTAALARQADADVQAGRIRGINEKFQAEVARPCSRSFSRRFPFSSSAASEVSLADFEDFFAPDGIEASFVQQHLAPLIKQKDSTISSGTLSSIRQAERVREAFFDRGREFGFTYQLTGVDVDDRIGQLVIESGNDQRVRFKHGPPVPLSLTWPDSAQGLTISFTRRDGSKTRQVIEGPWAIFRAVSAGRAASDADSASTTPLVTFSDGEVNATFRINSDSRINPFLPGLLDNYRCRDRL